MQADRTKGNSLISAIHESVDWYMSETNQKSKQRRLNYTRVMCVAATVNLGPRVVFWLLKLDYAHDSKSQERLATRLTTAAYFGDSAVLARIVNQGLNVDLNAQSRYFGRSLEAAARRGNIWMVSFLLGHGASVGTALQEACGKGHEEIVNLLLGQKLTANQGRHDIEKAILYSAWGDHPCLVRKLLAEDKTKKSKPSLTAMRHRHKLEIRILHEASKSGARKVVQFMLDRGVDVNGVDPKGYSALQKAASEGFGIVVQILLAGGANRDYSNNGSALEFASISGYYRTVQILLDKGANINGARAQEQLQEIVRRDNTYMISYLVERGFDLHRRRCGYLALDYAISHGHRSSVQFLLENGVSPNPPLRRITWLFRATRYGLSRLAARLVRD